MFYWSFTSLVHFWTLPIFNSGYAYEAI